jgi:unsaturated rhamnogalacturonyl hydrolase
MVNMASNSYWTWIDALQMAMPLFAKMRAIEGTEFYSMRMYGLYNYTKTSLGLYNETDHLWWRDATFKKEQSPGGKNIYWSRGNGWVFAALARVLNVLPASDTHRGEYVTVFREMAAAVKAVQRSDGFWNENLADPAHFGGPEVTGTGLFTYGMAWGVNNGVLNKEEYAPVIARAWNAIADSALFSSGALGYVQGTGDSPGDNGSGVTNVTPSRNMVPDFDDFGLGCVLLAGSETAKLADGSVAVGRTLTVDRSVRTTGVSTYLWFPEAVSFSQLHRNRSVNLTLCDLLGKSVGRAVVTPNSAAPVKGIPAPGVFIVYSEDR